MTNVFDMFPDEPFEYLEVNRGEVFGNRITTRKDMRGIVKIRKGMTRDIRNIETSGGSKESDRSTVHVRPTDFPNQNTESLIGNGIHYDGVDYEIVGATEGRDFNSGKIDHLTLTLREADYADES